MVALALYFGMKKDIFGKLGAKILVFGLALYAVIPVSVHASQLIYNTYQESINATLEETDKMISQTQETTDEALSGQQTTDQETDEGIFSGLIDKAKDTIDKAKNSVGIASEQFKYMLNKFIDGLAVLIVTTCLIPVLVMVFFVWLVKLLLGNWKSSLPC